MSIKSWRCVAKLDPERQHSDELLRFITTCPIDAVLLGGTAGITRENATDLALALRQRRMRVPIWQEISDPDAIAFGVDGYLIPLVLNATDIDFLARAHVKAIRRYRENISWKDIAPVGYIVMHAESAVCRRTKADIPRDLTDVLALAEFGARLCGLRTLYIEYSGKLGDANVPQQVTKELPGVQVFYGGGIASAAQLAQYQRAASTVVVGNALYIDPRRVFAADALCTTIAAVHLTESSQ